MIFTSFDSADNSALRNVKTVCLQQNGLEKKEIIDTSEESVRFRDIQCNKQDSLI
jgi:hypothetical protein